MREKSYILVWQILIIYINYATMYMYMCSDAVSKFTNNKLDCYELVRQVSVP